MSLKACSEALLRHIVQYLPFQEWGSFLCLSKQWLLAKPLDPAYRHVFNSLFDPLDAEMPELQGLKVVLQGVCSGSGLPLVGLSWKERVTRRWAIDLRVFTGTMSVSVIDAERNCTPDALVVCQSLQQLQLTERNTLNDTARVTIVDLTTGAALLQRKWPNLHVPVMRCDASGRARCFTRTTKFNHLEVYNSELELQRTLPPPKGQESKFAPQLVSDVDFPRDAHGPWTARPPRLWRLSESVACELPNGLSAVDRDSRLETSSASALS